MLGLPLDVTPGTRYAYSRFGYPVLGRIVERVSGDVIRAVRKTRGARASRYHCDATRHIALRGRAPDEVRYYDRSSMPSVFAGGGSVSAPYGGFNIEAMDAHGRALQRNGYEIEFNFSIRDRWRDVQTVRGATEWPSYDLFGSFP